MATSSERAASIAPFVERGIGTDETDSDKLPLNRAELFAAIVAQSRAEGVAEDELGLLHGRLKSCLTFGEYRAVVAEEREKIRRRTLPASAEVSQPENAVEFSQFIGSIRDPEVARGYEALAVESVWVGTYQHRAMPGYTFPYSVEILSRRGFLLTARQVVDFPPAMGGKSADLLFDMRVARVAQASLDHASPSGVWLEVVNVDKERMQYAWRLSGAGHSLSLSCTLRGNTGVQDFLAYRKWPVPPSAPGDGANAKVANGDRTSASARTSVSSCALQ